MKYVTVTLVTQEDGHAKSAVLSSKLGDLGSVKVDPFFISDLRAVLNEIDPQTGTGCTEAGQMSPAPETAQVEAEQTEKLSFSQALQWIRRGYAVQFSDMLVDRERVYMVKLQGKGDRDYIVYNDGNDTIDSKWRPSHRHMLNDEWRVLLQPR